MTEKNDIFIKMAIAGTSCAMVSSLLNPVDVTKIRMQNQSKSNQILYKNFFQATLKIITDEGIIGWCRGLPASIYRELSYSSIRIGAYEPIRYKLCDITQSQTSPLVKYTSALLSGFIGSFAANPLDLVKTRFQATLPNISNKDLSIGTLQALYNIYKSQGWLIIQMSNVMCFTILCLICQIILI